MSSNKQAIDQFKRPMRDLRVSVIDDCNFRCTYCMPRESNGHAYTFLRPDERLTYAEIARLISLFAQLGVRKVKLTGGEPLLRPWLDTLVGSITSLPGIEDVGLITNGYHLNKSAARLRAAGLHRVTVSLDSVDDETWRAVNGRGYPVKRVLDGIDAAVAAGFRPVNINAVVQRGINDHQLLDMVRAFRSPEFRLRFIEYMDVGTLNHWQSEKVVPSRDILRLIHAEYPLEPVESAYVGEVAQRYRYKDGKGEIGFVSSVTEPFCSNCTRARLSADGRLYTCLFADHGYDLRGPLRSGVSDGELLKAIGGVWKDRTDRYSELRSESGRDSKVEMYQIGG